MVMGGASRDNVMCCSCRFQHAGKWAVVLWALHVSVPFWPNCKITSIKADHFAPLNYNLDHCYLQFLWAVFEVKSLVLGNKELLKGVGLRSGACDLFLSLFFFLSHNISFTQLLLELCRFPILSILSMHWRHQHHWNKDPIAGINIITKGSSVRLLQIPILAWF